MLIKLAFPVIAAALSLSPMPSVTATPPPFTGDVYTTVNHCIYDGDGNLTECEDGFSPPFINPFADLDTSRIDYLTR